MKRVALYARISTAQHHQDPEVQLRELRAYLVQRDLASAGEYVDAGISGTRASRPALDRLMRDARAHLFDVVLVWKFDRFARSAIHLARALEEFKGLGIAFVSYTEQVDTATPAGKLVFTILGAVAEMERELIVERIRAGLRNARAKGRRLGRPALGLAPRDVHAAVTRHGTVTAAARALGVSYGTAWALNKRRAP
jgi:DNA invertase Pin-like site-specific DNA recombinase